MIPDTLNSETHVTQIKIENEINTKIKKSTNNRLTSVKYNELRQKHTEACKRNAEIVKVVNGNAAVANVQVCGKLFTSTNVYQMEIGDKNDKKKGRNSKRKKSVFYPTKYWVQVQADTVERGEPLDYTPDRNPFLAKVFLLTLIMLLITASFVGFICVSDEMRSVFADQAIGRILFMGGIGGMVLLNCALICSPCMRMFPCDIITLVLAVIFMTMIASFITAAHDTVVIAYALLATAVTVFVCLILAMTSFDFTQFMLYIFVIGIAFSVLTLIVAGTSLIFGIQYKPLHLVLLFVGTILNVVVLIMELQMILGGKTVQLGENEYAFGALMLYTSIIDLFLKLVQLLGIFMEEGEDFF